MTVEIIGVGVFRQIMQKSKISLVIEPVDGRSLGVNEVVEKLDAIYEGQFAKELYLENGDSNLWTRIMLNGRDIRFMEEDKLFVRNGDTILISSVMAGG